MIELAIKSGSVEGKMQILKIGTQVLIAGLTIRVFGLQTVGFLQLVLAICNFIIGISGIPILGNAIIYSISKTSIKSKNYTNTLFSSLLYVAIIGSIAGLLAFVISYFFLEHSFISIIEFFVI